MPRRSESVLRVFLKRLNRFQMSTLLVPSVTLVIVIQVATAYGQAIALTSPKPRKGSLCLLE